MNEYCPYIHMAKEPPRPQLPNNGLVVASGRSFTIAPRKQIKERGIKVRKSGTYVEINGTIRPVWEKANWDMCRAIGELFMLTGVDCELADYVVS